MGRENPWDRHDKENESKGNDSNQNDSREEFRDKIRDKIEEFKNKLGREDRNVDKLSTDKSAFRLKNEALRLVRNLSFQPGFRSHKPDFDRHSERDFDLDRFEDPRRSKISEKLADRLNSSLQHFVGPNRISSDEVFRAEIQVSAVSKATGDNRSANISRKFARADRKLANTSLADARRVLELLDERGVSFDEEEVRDSIEDAERKLEHGDRLWSKGLDVAPIAQYKESWEESQEALDTMDSAVVPQVNITRRTDPPHNDTINYTVTGTVFDVGVHEIQNVTVSVNGNNRTIQLFSSGIPGLAGRFSGTVELSERVNEVRVTAIDTTGGDTGSDSLRLDGDSLTDVYEQNATKTDPLDPDSDSSATSRNEVDNGTRDDREDLDGDGLTNIREQELGTKPLVKDTDSDGLPDGYEVVVTGTNPIENDSDGDGLTDGREVDGYPDEFMFVSDSMAEVLDPHTILTKEQLKNNGTGYKWTADPSEPNTDGKGLQDAEEIQRGTDPKIVERLIISLNVPTLAIKDGDSFRVVKSTGSTPGQLKNGYKIAKTNEYRRTKHPSGSVTYRIPAYIFIGSKGIPEEQLPESYEVGMAESITQGKFIGVSKNKGGSYGDGVLTDLDPGVNQIYIKIRSDAGSDFAPGIPRLFERFELKVFMDEDDFARDEDEMTAEYFVASQVSEYPYIVESSIIDTYVGTLETANDRLDRFTTAVSLVGGGVAGLELALASGSVRAGLLYSAITQIEPGVGEAVSPVLDGTASMVANPEIYTDKIQDGEEFGVDTGPIINRVN